MGIAPSVRKRGLWLGATAALVLTGAIASPATAGVAEFPLTTGGSQPTGIVSGPDGNLWVAEVAGSRIARVTPGGTVTEFTLPAGREPTELASLGGAIYFTERAGNRIGRINPAAGTDPMIQASIAEFTVPGAGSAPTGIAAGSDGAVWFTETAANEIGRMTTAGVITNEYPVPGAGSDPYGIVAGPDGNLWFTESGSSEIGRITTGGAITEFGVPGLESAPNDLRQITTGPDGALWFANAGVDHIGRVSTDGSQSRFPAPAGSGLEDIATGPDGALWFTQGRAGKIGRMTTGGAVAEYTLPTGGSGPAGITAGPDGALWFTERLAAQAGSITTDTAPDSPPTGPPGPTGPAGPAGADAKLILVAFAVQPRKPRAGRPVKVRFVVTAAAQASLAVQRLGNAGRGPAETVATTDMGAAGIGKLAWNGKLRGKRATPGRYRLTVTARSGDESVLSSLRTRLRPRRR